ncbi:hypothetical protein [Synechococcus sp. MIT S9503]|uniref:hypothetical protein n=1 Tax=Synechococcus sp. MIT S9503 TaxID=3082547 RepID=UPI0039A488FE
MGRLCSQRDAALMRRLEQVAALVVAAGLALVSYWLFFSWAGGGGSRDRQPVQDSTTQSSQLIKDHLSL